MSHNKITRRRMLTQTASFAAMTAAASEFSPLLAAPDARPFKIGACDWSIGKGADVAAMQVASDIGLDGVQVSFGANKQGGHLQRAEVQKAYLEAADKYGTEIASLAMGELNSVPYKSEPQTEKWVSDVIDACQALGTNVVLLAFFGRGNLKGDKPGMKEVARRLKKVAPKAEKAGVILGIESRLSAAEHIEIIDAVGSPSVQVYYDVANSLQGGYDIYKEIRWLGKKQICEIHMKENGFLLGQGKVDFKKVRRAIDDAGYRGWLIIEGAVPRGKSMIESYKLNQKFLRDVFKA